MKFKLDENLSPALPALSSSRVTRHEAHTILERSLGGKSDAAVIEVCAREGRALITLDLDFPNIQQYRGLAIADLIEEWSKRAQTP